MQNSQQTLKPNLQQTPNPKCLETITDQTNNNNKPCNPNQRTQSNPTPTNKLRDSYRKSYALWLDFGIEKIDNDIGAIIRIGPETALVLEAKKLRRPSGVKLAMTVVEHDKD